MSSTMFTGFAETRPLYNEFLSERFPLRLPAPREVLVEWSMQSSGCGQLNMLYVESDFIFYRKCVLQCYSKICHGIGKWKSTTAKFSSWVIAREGLTSETIWYSVVGHHGSILLQLHIHVYV